MSKQYNLAAIWRKAQYVSPEAEAKGFRKDVCGAWIQWSEYGKRDSAYGWEVDHIKPDADNGTDELSNLRPLHWENNAAKSDGKLVCAVRSNGNRNVAA